MTRLRIEAGVSSLQGHRYNMEDEHVVIEDLTSYAKRQHGESFLSDTHFRAFFAVYDGHCGKQAAEFARDKLHNHLVAHPKFREAAAPDAQTADLYSQALGDAFSQTDKEFLQWAHKESNDAGCTAIAAFVTDALVVVGNLGDARCVLSRDGKVVELSRDHKPGRDDERARILKAGGFVVNNRINSFLAVSRAIGDRDYKNWEGKMYFHDDLVSNRADVRVEPIQAHDDFLILACDGVWDVMSSQDVVDYVRKTHRILLDEQKKKDEEAQTSTQHQTTVAQGSQAHHEETNNNSNDSRSHSSSSSEEEQPQNQPEESKSITQKLADKLSREAITRGSSDNVTAIVVSLKRE